MARIPYPDPSILSAKARAKYDLATTRERMGARLMMAYVEPTREKFEALGLHFLRSDGVFTAQEREVVVLTVGRLCKCDYEIFQHIEIARIVGLDDYKIQNLVDSKKDSLSQKELMLVAFSEEIHAEGKVSDATFNAARTIFSNAQLVELPLLIGYYIMFSAMVRTLEVETDERPVGQDTLDAE